MYVNDKISVRIKQDIASLGVMLRYSSLVNKEPGDYIQKLTRERTMILLYMNQTYNGITAQNKRRQEATLVEGNYDKLRNDDSFWSSRFAYIMTRHDPLRVLLYPSLPTHCKTLVPAFGLLPPKHNIHLEAREYY
jgi:hypothetical protein